MNKIINAGIQVVPLDKEAIAFPIIDNCIGMIRESGLSFQVNAMETVVEAKFQDVQLLIEKIHALLSQHSELDYLLNVRYHVSNRKDVSAKEKTEKHR